ncbi:unnamed protein product [Closterium sp. Yama58-4]|nr:unnamed protein product [Closterium sp. Yama58-4]
MATVTIPAAKASLAPVARSENKSAGAAKVGFASSGLAGARLTTKAPRAAKQAATNARPAAPRAVIDSSGAKDVCMDPDVSQSVLGIILGGGAGTRLYPLTKKRAKPAVPLGANYRLIDIPVSNCINSNIVKIYVMTQFNSASLNRHLSRAYTSNMGGYKTQGFVEVLAAQQSPENPNWFQGTADAVRQYLWQLEEQNVQEYLILAGDHLYRMDYQRFIKCHRENDADITIAALPMDEKRAEAFGLMKIDDTGRIVEFAEKPKGEALKAMQVDTTILGLDAERAKELPYIASMGIYVISKDAMIRMLAQDFPDANDFGSEVIPGACAKGAKVQAFLYDGYWEDIGTIEAFYNANLSTTQPDSPFSFYDRSAPIYTQARYLPPSKLQSVDISESVIGEGCIIEDSQLHHSVIGLRAKIGAGSIIKDTLVMGADYYETEDQQDALLASGGVPIGIGKNVVIQKAIIDKNARIGDNVQIINKDQVEEAARETDETSSSRYVLVAWIADGSVYATDRFIFNKSVEGVALDDQQDWRVLGGFQTTDQTTGDTWTTVHVWRKLDTGDCNDRPVVAGRLQNVIWGKGETSEFGYHGTSSRGSAALVLVPAPAPSILAPPSPPSASSASAESGSQRAADLGQANGQVNGQEQQLNWTLNNFAVPANNDTTYVCKTFDLPFTNKVHITEFGVLLNSTYPPSVHHAIVYGCSQSEYPNIAKAKGQFDCITAPPPCLTTIAMWAIGGRPFLYPDGVGYPVGPGYFTRFVLQVHLNNADLRSDIVDNSGFSLKIADPPRPTDAGIILTGPVDYTNLIRIPPGMPSWTQTTTCPGACTSALYTDAYRGGKKVAEIDRLDYYNSNSQQVQPIYPHYQLLPGDELKTTCVWDSTSRSQVTPGGPSTSDEMCVDYLIYYPARPTQVLGSCFDFCAAFNSVNNTFDMNPKNPNLTTFYFCGGLENPYVPTANKCSISHGANVPFKVLTGCPAKTAGSLATLSSSNISVPVSSPTSSTAPPPPTSPSSNSTGSTNSTKAATALFAKLSLGLFTVFCTLFASM